MNQFTSPPCKLDTKAPSPLLQLGLSEELSSSTPFTPYQRYQIHFLANARIQITNCKTTEIRNIKLIHANIN
jgi:hypothetical protein